MELLAEEKSTAISLIREELCCGLCGRVYEDPQCLNCKHNFCRECIDLHLRKTESSCPNCFLPCCPRDLTRNQFLQSILFAWKQVEEQIKLLNSNTSTNSTSTSITGLCIEESARPKQKKMEEDDVIIIDDDDDEEEMDDSSQSSQKTVMDEKEERQQEQEEDSPIATTTTTTTTTSTTSSSSSSTTDDVMVTQEVEQILEKIQEKKDFLTKFQQKKHLLQLPDPVEQEVIEILEEEEEEEKGELEEEEEIDDGRQEEETQLPVEEKHQLMISPSCSFQLITAAQPTKKNLLKDTGVISSTTQKTSRRKRRRIIVEDSEDSEDSEEEQEEEQENKKKKKKKKCLEQIIIQDTQQQQQQQQQEEEEEEEEEEEDEIVEETQCPIDQYVVTTSSSNSQKKKKKPKRLSDVYGSERPPQILQRRLPLSTSQQQKPLVFIATDLLPHQTQMIRSTIKKLGTFVHFGKDFDRVFDSKTGHLTTSVTHLITQRAIAPRDFMDSFEPNEKRCKRTAKYMRALAEGVFVMDFSWIEASWKAGHWLKEDKFEMDGDVYSTSIGKPREYRLRRELTGQRSRLFKQMHFLVLCEQEEFDYSITMLPNLVMYFQGKMILPHKLQDYLHKSNSMLSQSPNYHRRVGIISRKVNSERAREFYRIYHMPIVRVTWLFDSISHMELLPFEDYYQY